MTQFHRVGAALLAFALALAACSDGGSTGDGAAGAGSGSGTSETTVPAEVDPDGVLRIAYPMDRLTLDVEPENNLIFGLTSATHQGLVSQIVGTPLVLGADGTYEPFLAESYEVVDDRTVNLVIRAGLTFHDGSPYTAQVLADTMLNYQALDTAAFATTVLDKIESIEVASETDLVFHMSEPVAGRLPETLSSHAAMVAAPTSNGPSRLYGAGPFRVAEFVRDDHLTLERFDDYWNADAYPLARVEIVNIPDGEAAQNALLGNQVDLIAANPAQVDALLQQGPFASVVTHNQGHYMMAVCNTAPPFDDPAFREAVDLAIDREQLNQVALGGAGEPLESLWNPDSTFAIEGLIDPDGDQDRAREILDEIGWDESTVVNLGYFSGFQTHQRMVETIQGQLEQVGIETEISVIEDLDVTERFSPEAGGGFYVVANVHSGIQSVAVPGASASTTWNPCGFSDPELQGLMDPLIAGDLSESDQMTAWSEVQEYVIGGHLWFPLLSQPSVYVYNSDRVQGIEPGTIGLSGATAPALSLEGVSIKAS